MTQDFATTGKTKRASTSRKGPKRSKSRSNQKGSKAMQQTNVPAWVWIFTGIIAGAFIMFLVYLSGLAPESMQSNNTKPAIDIDVPENLKNKAKPVFEFYDRLMNSEVVVDVEIDDTVREEVVYILQAASFQQYDEADALKALLTLEGLDVDIQEFKNKGETWHRVLVGPFESRSKMAKARSTLAQHDMSPITLKKKID